MAGRVANEWNEVSVCGVCAEVIRAMGIVK